MIVYLAAMGDFFLFLDTAKALRKAHGDTPITLIGNALWLELAQALPYFDEVIGIESRRFRNDLGYRYRTLAELRKLGAQITLHPVYSRTNYFMDGEAIVRALATPHKVGSVGEGRGWRYRTAKRWYSQLLPSTSEPLTELERNGELMQQLGLDYELAVPSFPLEVLPPREVEANRYYVLVPGAGSDLRKWPPEQFAKLAEHIYSTTGLTGLVCGSPGERDLAQTVIGHTHVSLENWAGRTSLLGYIRLLADAQLVVSNETSAVHIAATVQTPSVCILGGGHFGRFVPYPPQLHNARYAPLTVTHEMPCFKCNWNCIYPLSEGSPAPCVEGVSLEDVWRACRTILTSHSSSDSSAKTR